MRDTERETRIQWDWLSSPEEVAYRATRRNQKSKKKKKKRKIGEVDCQNHVANNYIVQHSSLLWWKAHVDTHTHPQHCISFVQGIYECM